MLCHSRAYMVVLTTCNIISKLLDCKGHSGSSRCPPLRPPAPPCAPATDPTKCYSAFSGRFPGGPVGKTPCSQHRGRGFEPCSGNQDPACRAAQPKKKKGSSLNQPCLIPAPLPALLPLPGKLLLSFRIPLK